MMPPALTVIVPENPAELSAPSVRVAVPDLVNPTVPARVELIVPAFVAVTVGVVPPSVIVPVLRVPAVENVIPLVKTVPFTVALRFAKLKTATFVGPLVASQGVPVTPVQLVGEVSQTPVVVPLQVPVAAHVE